MAHQKIAVVTGSNKGIGFAIVKGLCEKYCGRVYLLARDLIRGEEAVAKMKALGFDPLFHQLDIIDQSSIDKFKEHIMSTHGGIDILVNNAGISFGADSPEPFADQAEQTILVNYFGTLRVCEALFPLLRDNARVINVSSSAGHLKRVPSEQMRSKLADPTLTVPELNNLMEKFVHDAKNGIVKQDECKNFAYVVSKAGVSALTIIQQRLFDAEIPNRNISVNSVHPGYVDTDMTKHKGPLTVEEGARAPLFLALEADLRGEYVWFDCQVIDWYGDSTPPIS